MCTRKIILILLPTALLLTGCKTRQETIDRAISFFSFTHYEGVPDDRIISIEPADSLPSVSKVTWQYGLNQKERYFYEDTKGKTVPIKDTNRIAENGYPVTSGYLWRINNDGFVVFDWSAYLLYFLVICVVFFAPTTILIILIFDEYL